MNIINIQPIQKRDISSGLVLSLHSLFYTVQGEGPYCGHPAIFVRLAGCNLQCPSCFVKNTKIRMANGTSKNISEVKVGELVLAYNEAKGSFEPKKVLRTMVNETRDILRVYTGTRSVGNGGNTTDLIYCTPEHPFLVKDKGWVEAQHLTKNDKLLHYSNSDHMTLFNSIKKPGAVEKLKNFYQSADGLAVKEKTQAWRKNGGGDVANQAASDRMVLNNPMKNPATVEKAFLSRKDRGHKTTAERKFEKICEGLPIEFVGDGSLVVSHKFPDFVVRGQKKLIEVWSSDAPHACTRGEDWSGPRANLFRKEGYETLFVPIPDRNVDIEGIRKKVSEFIHNGEIVAQVDRIEVGSKTWVALTGGSQNLCKVYNLEVEDLHTYVANGKIVHNCDTEYTDGAHNIPITELIYQIKALHESLPFKPLVVITGGEPFRQNIGPLCQILIECCYRVQIETNGTLSPPAYDSEFPDFRKLWSQVTIVCSPKAGKINPVTELYTAAFKYVLSHDSVDPVDGLPILALNHSASPRVARPTSKGQPVYLQPMDAKDDTINALNVEAVKQSCMTHGYILQLQTHKIINVA